eukprot:5912956-Alexandrium_andersonii.AAC.1
MSASLVGSEMCIRDSVKQGSPAKARQRRQARRRGAASRARRALLASGAVSYTHLTLPTICSV